MDSKIIAAIIIALGFVAGVYIYTQDNAYNRCVSAWTDRLMTTGSEPSKQANREAKDLCLGEQRHFKDSDN